MSSNMRPLFSVLGLALVCALGGGGCSSTTDDSDSQEPPAFNAVDESISCASGQIGWNFSTGGGEDEAINAKPPPTIRVAAATYGGNCGNPALEGNHDTAARFVCNGFALCKYEVRNLGNTDPAPKCAKEFDVSWTCGAESPVYRAKVTGEANGKTVDIACSPKVNVVSGTFGGNCGAAKGNRTAELKATCEAERGCTYPVVGLPDAAPGCAKSYVAEWTCGEGTNVFRAEAASEATGKSVSLICDPTPKINVVSGLWGASCNVAKNATHTQDLRSKCDGTTSCDYTIGRLTDPARGCQKSYDAVWTCGEDTREYTTSVAKVSDGKIAKLSCVGASGFKTPTSEYATGERGCVPKTCPWNTRRDARQQCVPANKVLLNKVELYRFGLLERSDNTNVVSSFTRVAAQPAPLSFNVPYKFTATVDVSGPAASAPLTTWITDEFGAGIPFTRHYGKKVSGFVCTAMNVDVQHGYSGKEAVRTGASANVLSHECTDPRRNSFLDAATRLGISEQEFRLNFGLIKSVLHYSFDPKGTVGVKALGDSAVAGHTPLAPNPVGFFYDAKKGWVDMIAFYQQRELLVATETGERVDTRKVAIVYSSKMVLEQTGFDVRDGAALNIALFSPDTPYVGVDVAWNLIGDAPGRNPWSPGYAFPNLKNLKSRNIRASVEIYPPGREDEAIALGKVPLDQGGAATGSVKSAPLSVGDALKDKLFGAWQDVLTFDVKSCIELDGYSLQKFQSGYGIVDLVPNLVVDGAPYTMAVSGICRRRPGAITVSRDFEKRPLPYQRQSSNIANAKSSASGDTKASGESDDGQEKTCTETGSGNTLQQVCTTARRTSSGTKGEAQRSYYSSQSSAVRVETATEVRATPSLRSEILGFQVVDIKDSSQSKGFQKGSSVFASKAAQKISIGPNWDLIVQTLRESPAPNPEWTKGKYGGQMGLGVGISYKQPVAIGPVPGLVKITASVGVSVGLGFELKFQPDSPYPCLPTSTSIKKCFSQRTELLTQPEANKKCLVQGGRLAEMATVEDRVAIAAAASGNNDYWIGGQASYRPPSAICARSPGAAGCTANTKTSYRWIGSDAVFATAPSFVVDPSSIGAAASDVTLTSQFPTDQGILYQGATRKLRNDLQSKKAASVCEYDAADRATFGEWSLGLPFGAGGGVQLALCVPDDDLGICLEGNFNVIDVGITPTIGQSAFTLYRGGRRIGTRTNGFVKVPWALTLFAGDFKVTANYVVGSASWTLAQYPGFIVAQGDLYSYDFPSREVF